MSVRDLYYALGAGAAALQRHRPVGRSIYDADWDICVILDSCRVDLLRACWDREVGAAWSVGSITTEWLCNTFHRVHAPLIAGTALVSATPHSTTVFREGEWLTNQDAVGVPYPESPAVGPEAFAGFYEVWRTHATDHNAVPPETMLDATLEAYDRHERVVAHWLQPHEPFIAPDAELVGGDATTSNVWDGLQAGDLDPDTVWQSYRATLEHALDSLDTLCRAVDARILVTADHGNAFGEWGIYGHPFAWPQPAVRRVPWCFVDATPGIEHPKPDILDADADDAAVGEQLRALGYR